MKRRIRVELGSVWLGAEAAANLAPGSEISLGESAAGEVAIVADGRRIARGELMVTDGCYCVRADEILCPVSQGTDRPMPRPDADRARADSEN